MINEKAMHITTRRDEVNKYQGEGVQLQGGAIGPIARDSRASALHWSSLYCTDTVLYHLLRDALKTHS